MMFIQHLLGLAIVASGIRSIQGLNSRLRGAPTLIQEMVYDEDLRCARIVRRRLMDECHDPGCSEDGKPYYLENGRRRRLATCHWPRCSEDGWKFWFGFCNTHIGEWRDKFDGNIDPKPYYESHPEKQAEMDQLGYAKLDFQNARKYYY